MYRQQGGFVPRTAHDYSSLMIFISGLVNPNPCRNCLLRNGPFARCVVAPPAVLAISTLRHGCANCTYQNQYKKCTNDPISAQEKARSELLRPVARSKSAVPKPTIPRKPKLSKALRHHEKKAVALQRRSQEQRLEGRGIVPPTQPSASLNRVLGASFETFDEKLKHVRGCSPNSRRRITAEILQWQAAIATVEVEEPPPAPANMNALPANINPRPENIDSLRASLDDTYSPSQSASQSASTSTFRASLFRFAPPVVSSSLAGARDTSYSAEQTYDPMDEDEGEGEQGDGYEGTPWLDLNQIGSIIKAPR